MAYLSIEYCEIQSFVEHPMVKGGAEFTVVRVSMMTPVRCAMSGGKVGCETKEIAQATALYEMRNRGNTLRLYVYECPYCKRFHLTKKAPEKSP